MRLIVTIAVCCIALFAAAQDEPISFSARQTYVGQHLINNSNLHSVKYDAGQYQILNYAKSNDNRKIYLFMKEANDNGYYKKGDYIVYFDVVEGKISSQIKLHGKGTGYKMYEHYVTRNSGDVRGVYNPNTGKRMWYTNGYLSYVDTQKNLCITQDGVCFDMLTGRKRWSHKIGVNYDWVRMAYRPDENTLITVTDGLQGVDLNSGEGWYFPIEMLNSEAASMGDVGDVLTVLSAGLFFGAVGAGIAGGIISEHDTSLRSRLCSNIVQKHDRLYFAGNREIVCFSKTGNLFWKSDLPYAAAGSEIIMQDDMLLLISTGMKRKAAPYIAAYNVKTGELIYKILMVGQDYVWSYMLRNDIVSVRTNAAITLYNRGTGALIAFSDMDKKEGISEFKTLANCETIFIHDSLSNKNISLAEAFPGSYFLCNRKKELLRLDDKLNLAEVIGQGQYGTEMNLDVGYKPVVMPGNKVYIKNGSTEVALLDNLPQLKCDNKLVNIEPKGITVTDIPVLQSP